MEATRAAVKRLDAVNLAILLEGEDWKPPNVRVRAGISDPTGKAGIYRAEELPEVMKRLRDEKAELESYIGTSLRLIENVRKGLGTHYFQSPRDASEEISLSTGWIRSD